MLRSLKDLESYKVSATDGDIGRVTDFLFDDRHWTTRYLVTDTSGFWEEKHQVLVSPISFRQVDWATRLFHLGLTQAKLKGSPSVDLARPVSRQYEQEYFHYFEWPYYWGYGGIWGMDSYPFALAKTAVNHERTHAQDTLRDPHLRSSKTVAGYHVRGSDGDIGYIVDFIVDDETWTIRYLVIDIGSWWFGRKVLVAPQWAEDVSWSKNVLCLNLTIEAIKSSPTWSPTSPINREYEERLYDYYGRPVYWTSQEASGQVPPVGS